MRDVVAAERLRVPSAAGNCVGQSLSGARPSQASRWPDLGTSGFFGVSALRTRRVADLKLPVQEVEKVFYW
ncbi:hypothetical protein VULLAG_LOCUS19154 [Vulpes lagopus]